MIKNKLNSRSERVKSVELHPELPWVLSALYSGKVIIYDYETQTAVKTFEVSSVPVRTAKFVVRKPWVVTGAGDNLIRVFDYDTMEKVATLDGHADFVRCIAVHPTLPLILSSSDDLSIKVWNWEENFTLVKTLKEHGHYVMQVCVNPKDLNSFASASLDKTIKIWNLNQVISGNTADVSSNFSLGGHEGGVNCIDYYRGNKPYLTSGSDDFTVKVWDYQKKQCLHTLEGHCGNVTSVFFHPELPILFSGSEDCVAKLWHADTYKEELSLNYGMGKVWGIHYGKELSNLIALAYDEGTVVVRIGSDEPVCSISNGKFVIAKNLEILTASFKALNDPELLKDGESIPIILEELGVSDVFPQNIKYAPNGNTFAIVGNEEYSVIRAEGFQNVTSGSGSDFVWSPSGGYAVRNNSNVSIFEGMENQKKVSLKTDFAVDAIFGGPLLAIKSTELLVFYDWTTTKVVSRRELSLSGIYWNETGNIVAIITSEKIIVLAYNNKVVSENLDTADLEKGLETAFDVLFEVNDHATSAVWINDVLFYTNFNGKLQYAVCGKSFDFALVDKSQHILGYVASQNRLYLTNRRFDIISFEVSNSVTQYQSNIAGKNSKKASELEDTIPVKYHDKLARFLDQIDRKEEAFMFAKDPEYKFELAIQLDKTEEAFNLAKNANSIAKWKQVGDLALLNGNTDLAIESLEACNDLSRLLVIYSSLGSKDRLRALAAKAEKLANYDISFNCYLTLGDNNSCTEALLKLNRIPEAAFFAKTYCPSKTSKVVQLWKQEPQKENNIESQKIADPMDPLDSIGLGFEKLSENA